MASLRDIKNRIRSVKSTQKITKAMEMIAASKMRRAQSQALKGRPYITKLTEVIDNLVYLSDPPLGHPLLERHRVIKNIGYIFITANRGLCGSYNSAVIRTMLEVIAEHKDANENIVPIGRKGKQSMARSGKKMLAEFETMEEIMTERNEINETVLTIGRKGRQSMERIGKKVLADFESMTDKPRFTDTVGISQIVMDDYIAGSLDEVYFVYNHFYSVVSQKPVVEKLLPITAHREGATEMLKRDYIFEPNRVQLLDELLRRYVQTIVYQKILEAIAAEQSARMMAMRQASDNATEIISNLTLHYNKGRQAKITKEILEVVSGNR
ncbi:MAG: FoF1 ATP synthase subunit gamma [Patescibacteria group bacterium]